MPSTCRRTLQGEGAVHTAHADVVIDGWAGCYLDVVKTILRRSGYGRGIVVVHDGNRLRLRGAVPRDLGDRLAGLVEGLLARAADLEARDTETSDAELDEWHELILQAEHAGVLSRRLFNTSAEAVGRPSYRAQAG
ncbi:hypothetical protein ATK17_3852 [Branchiibius hedensis]|uniref:Uncharacterized protein n=1 Tax=Branchiibius hedensis TaxID=672460 RepID=A0A2Y9BLN7_9MICO|nr:hypothetical protein [Branchiibius hedensis]PWJ23358.1 hypothetical protein ATK17_3852 [Branchiibius hedensis]SSA59047.1 hypothetical protein SAMN04489750_3852 [Branchiibius hedensis]